MSDRPRRWMPDVLSIIGETTYVRDGAWAQHAAKGLLGGPFVMVKGIACVEERGMVTVTLTGEGSIPHTVRTSLLAMVTYTYDKVGPDVPVGKPPEPMQDD